MKRRLVVAVCAACLGLVGCSKKPDIEPAVDPKLREFQSRWDTPELVPMGPRVRMAWAYDYSNYAFIEGDDGVIAVDTGWFSGRTARALEDYRKITGKPVKAVIYTHTHGDHTGGAGVIVPESMRDRVVVYAHHGWRDRLVYDAGAGRMLLVRALSQMGALLPPKDLAKGTFGSGIGGVVQIEGKMDMVLPNRDVRDRLSLTVAGVRMELIHAPNDIPQQIMVWLPDDRVALVGDALGGALPYITTPRWEPDRDPADFLATLKKIRSLDPEHIVPGHGRPIIGRDDARRVVQDNYDVIKFLVDQVKRYIDRGYSADQIIDTLRLPPHLAASPDLQPHYHRLAWLIRGLYAREAGWVQNITSLTRHTDSQEARRWVDLVGRVTLMKAALQALHDKDYRWAVTLAQILLWAEPDNEKAQKLLLGGLAGIAYTTDSAGERNYVLTHAGTVSGKVPWDLIHRRVMADTNKNRSAGLILSTFPGKFRAEAALDLTFSIQIDVANEGSHRFKVDRGIIEYGAGAAESPNSVIRLSREALLSIASGELEFRAALTRADVSVDGDISVAHRFADLLEL